MARVKPVRRQGFTRLSSKRQVTLPLRVVEELRLKPGDELKVEASEGRVILARAEGLATRRRRALEEMGGGFAGIWEPGELERLRNEWR